MDPAPTPKGIEAFIHEPKSPQDPLTGPHDNPDSHLRTSCEHYVVFFTMPQATTGIDPDPARKPRPRQHPAQAPENPEHPHLSIANC